MKLNELFQERKNARILKAEYSVVDVQQSSKLRLVFEDEYHFLKRIDDRVIFVFERNVFLEPDGIFKIKIVGTVECKLIKEINEIDFEEFLSELSEMELEDLFGQLIAMMSLIVAQMSRYNHFTPVIIPTIIDRDSLKKRKNKS